jgi:uncharacterized protein
MNQNIIDFVTGKRIALLGASRSGKKFGNTLFAELKERGYQVFLVHPEAKEINGEPCYSSLSALAGRVDSVLICLPPPQVKEALRQAAAAGIKKVWLQQGAESGDVLAKARTFGLNPVSGKCILMYAEPVRSFHRFHRGLVKLLGKY